MRKILIAALMLATPAFAQVELEILQDLQRDFGVAGGEPERGEITSQPRAGAMLRGLDKMTGRASDIPVMVGEEVAYERLVIRLDACRVPAEDETPDAYAFVELRDTRETEPRFSGWMIASSPALNAMDHPRYDIWVTDCLNDDGITEADAAEGVVIPDAPEQESLEDGALEEEALPTD